MTDTQTCTRDPRSVWTMCRCEDCRAISARNAKLFRNGRLPVIDRRIQAVRRLEKWIARGYSPTAIAEMTGLSDRAVQPMLAGISAPARMFHRTADMILNAPDFPTGNGWIPADGSVRRLRALTVMGWSMDELGARSGVQPSTLAAIRSGKHAQTRPRFAVAIAAAYDELWDVQGPGRHAGTRAKNRGWHGPLAWDDDTIDDPTAEPYSEARPSWTQRPATETAAEVDDYLEHVNPYATAHFLAEWLGYADVTGIQNALKRAGRGDLLQTLARNAHIATNVTGRSA